MDAVPQNFERNLQQLEEFHQRFIAALRYDLGGAQQDDVRMFFCPS